MILRLQMTSRDLVLMPRSKPCGGTLANYRWLVVWIGDSPLILLDCAKIRNLGWEPTRSIPQAIDATISWLGANSYVLDGEATP